LKKKINKEEKRKFINGVLGKQLLKQWDPLHSPHDYLMIILGIQSSDGKTDHAICITAGWIFDSNFKKALPLTQLNIVALQANVPHNLSRLQEECC
jgi:hypothetical protein